MQFGSHLKSTGVLGMVTGSHACTGGIQELISFDMSEDMIKRSQSAAASDGLANTLDQMPTMKNLHIVGDEEYLPFKPRCPL